MKMVERIQKILSKEDKRNFLFLIVFSIFISAVETIGVAAIMPFISVATDFSLIASNSYYARFYEFFHLTTNIEFVVIFGMLLVIFYFARSIINLVYTYTLSKFTYNRYSLIAIKLFKNYMDLSCKDYTSRNSSVMLKSIVTEASNLTQVMFSMLLAISEIFIVVFIYTIMLYVDYQIAFAITIILLLNTVLMLKTISPKIEKSGLLREKGQRNFFEVINRSFGNFKIIKLRSNQREILSDFGDSVQMYVNANINNTTLNQAPRLFLEAVAFSIVIFIVINFILIYDDTSKLIAVVSMFVVALYRLMPSASRIMNSYNNILFNLKSLNVVYEDLIHSVEDLGDISIKFKDNITLKNLGFEYAKGKPTLENINLTITKGESVAFIGESGSGKSTIVDIIIGLHEQTSGVMTTDGVVIDKTNIKSWRNKIGYIPQSVYLFDGTVGENVAFGLKYDKTRIENVLKQARIYKFLSEKEGVHTKVGEDGVMLSGGQKQRIAIARALYDEPEILVLDEATSSLDEATEAQIMDEIYDISKDKTLIIVAHRLSTLSRCDKTFMIQEGKIKN
jgi:ATP-binding cassette, subfamily B, bacterial PglK